MHTLIMQEEGVLKGQELENAVSDADYAKAIQIAFDLRRPHRLFELFSELCRLAVFYILFYVFTYLIGMYLVLLFPQQERL